MLKQLAKNRANLSQDALTGDSFGGNSDDKAKHSQASIQLLAANIPGNHGAVVVIDRFHSGFFCKLINETEFVLCYSHGSGFRGEVVFFIIAQGGRK